MNWFTKAFVKAQSLDKKKALLEQDGGCEHVQADLEKAAFLRSEHDSFGPVATCLCCEACDAAAEEAEGNEERICVDCKQKIKRKDGFEWKWYDFYAPQGDKPLFICGTCCKLPNHQARLARDRDDYKQEFGIDEGDY